MVFVFHHDRRPDLTCPRLQSPHKKTARSLRERAEVESLATLLALTYHGYSTLIEYGSRWSVPSLVSISAIATTRYIPFCGTAYLLLIAIAP